MDRTDWPTLSICTRCRDGREDGDDDRHGGRRLADAVARVFPGSTAERLGMGLRGVRCMSQCKRPCTLALSGPERFTYLFGDLDPQCHAEYALHLAALYAASPDGFLRRDERPRPMQAGILGRIPPLGIDPRHDLFEQLLHRDKTETENDT